MHKTVIRNAVGSGSFGASTFTLNGVFSDHPARLTWELHPRGKISLILGVILNGETVIAAVAPTPRFDWSMGTLTFSERFMYVEAPAESFDGPWLVNQTRATSSDVSKVIGNIRDFYTLLQDLSSVQTELTLRKG